MPAVLSSSHYVPRVTGLGALGLQGPRLQFTGSAGPSDAKLFTIVSPAERKLLAAQAAAQAAFAKAHPKPWASIVIRNGMGTPIYFPAANVAKVFKYFTNKQAGAPTAAWYAQGMVNTQDPGAVAITLNNMALLHGGFYPGSSFIYTGPAGLNNVGQMYGPINNPFPSLAAIAWGVQQGYLTITPSLAVAMQNYATAQGIVPPSFFEYIGKPILVIVLSFAIAEGAAAAEGGSAGAGAGAGGTGLHTALTATKIASGANTVISKLQPIDTSLLSSPVPPSDLTQLTQNFSLASNVGGGLNTAVQAAQGASTLQKVLSTVSTGEQVVGAATSLAPFFSQRGTPTTQPAIPGNAGSGSGAPASVSSPTSLKVILLLAAAGGAALLL